MRHIKTFNEIDLVDVEKIDEGWKEMVIAGAMALLPFGSKAQSTINTNNTQKSYGIQKSDSTTPQKAIAGKYQSNTILPSTNAIVVNFSNEFQSGAHRFDKSKSDSVENKLKEIANFLKSQSKNNIIIEIEAQESQVPNKDIETGNRLQKGQLANLRANNTKDLVESFIKTLSEKGEYKGVYKIDTATSIGKTPYTIGESPRQDKFTAEQFVKVKLSVKKDVASIKKSPDFSAYSKDDNRIFTVDSAGLKRALGDVFYQVRATQNIEDPGEVHGKDLLLRTISANGNYDGNAYIIPQSWWNQNVGQNYVTPQALSKIKAEFKVK